MTRKTAFFKGWSWFKFNNSGLAPGTNFFYTSVAKGLKLKVRKFLGLIPTFPEVTEEKLVGGAFFPPPILNSVKRLLNIHDEAFLQQNSKRLKPLIIFAGKLRLRYLTGF